MEVISVMYTKKKSLLLYSYSAHLAKLTLAFCPPLRLAPLSPTIAKSPPGSKSMSWAGSNKFTTYSHLH